MNQKVLLSKLQIQQKVLELAKEIAKDYKDKDLVLIGILNGSFIFLSDLIRELFLLGINPKLYFTGISSYQNTKESSKKPILTLDLKSSLEEKEVLIVEDIVDTGYSVDYLLSYLQAKNPQSIKVCTLLSKPSRREKEVAINYLGFEIDDVWVEGYGMDTEGKFRGSPDILVRNS